MKTRFTYGDQFSTGDRKGHVKLNKIIELSEKTIIKEEKGERFGDRELLRTKIGEEFFDHTADPRGNAGNTILSLNAYGLIDINCDNIGTVETYKTTSLYEELLNESSEQQSQLFVRHILVNLEGMLLVKIIEDMKSRGEKLTLESIGLELQEIGVEIPPNSTYISTMKSWLEKEGIFTGRYDISWDAVEELVSIRKNLVDDLYELNKEHKYFLLALINLGATELIPSNKVANYVRSVFRIKLTSKNLVKEVLTPLEDLGLIYTEKSTKGRGAKPHQVKLSEKSILEVLEPFLKRVSEITTLPIPTLNKPFKEVVENLDSKDSHEKGVALELLSIWIVRLLGLRFIEWRLRDSKKTGGGEVDILAGSDTFIYNRWQIQCKNTKSKVSVDEIAKEFGLTVITNADIILMVTTSEFTSDARNYADVLMSKSRYYVVLIDGDDLDRFIDDKTNIVEQFNDKAKQIFFRKEVLSRNPVIDDLEDG